MDQDDDSIDISMPCVFSTKHSHPFLGNEPG